MVLVLTRNWWALVIRGVAGLLFGLACFFWPDIALLSLVLLFGAYALVDGAFAIAAAISGADRDSRWWALLLQGIVGIITAVVAVVWPGITALALLYLIAAWALVTGILEIVAAVRLRKEIEGEWMLALAGFASVLFGIAIAVFPAAGALAVVWMIGVYALVSGVLLTAVGLRLRSLRKRMQAQMRGPTNVGIRGNEASPRAA
jgi:uncharacterized membrane protein HdeD (DUF308 family)